MFRLNRWAPAVALLSLAYLIGCGGDKDAPENSGGGDAQANQPAGGHGGGHTAGAAPAGGSSGMEKLGTGKPIDTSRIPTDAIFAVYLRPGQVLGAEALKPIVEDDTYQQLIAAGGVDPRDVEEIVVAGKLEETPFGPIPNVGVIVRFKAPYDAEAIGGTTYPAEAREEAEHDGVKYFRLGDSGMHFADERTILLFNTDMPGSLLAPGSGGSPLIDALQSLGGGDDLLAVVKFGPELKALYAQQKGMLEMQIGEHADLPEHFETVVLRTNLSPNLRVQVGLETDDPQVAGKLLSLSQDGLTQAKQQFAASKAQIAQSIPLLGPAAANLGEQVINTTELSADGRTFQVRLQAPEQLNAMLPVAFEMLKQQFLTARGAAQSSQGRSNLRQIGIALHNYLDGHRGEFPARATFEGDKPLLSWRVAVLPYLEGGQELYEQFQLDEPWDSEHNMALVSQIPDVYLTPGQAPDGNTRYLAVTGPGTAFDGTQGKRLAAFTDGLSNTVIVVEAAAEQAVPWTKPDDLNIESDGALDTLMTATADGFTALFADGRVQPINDTIDPETLMNLFTIADGNPVEIP